MILYYIILSDTEIFSIIINVFTVTFDQFAASFLNTGINFLNGSIYNNYSTFPLTLNALNCLR